MLFDRNTAPCKVNKINNLVSRAKKYWISKQNNLIMTFVLLIKKNTIQRKRKSTRLSLKQSLETISVLKTRKYRKKSKEALKGYGYLQWPIISVWDKVVKKLEKIKKRKDDGEETTKCIVVLLNVK